MVGMQSRLTDPSHEEVDDDEAADPIDVACFVFLLGTGQVLEVLLSRWRFPLDESILEGGSIEIELVE